MFIPNTKLPRKNHWSGGSRHCPLTGRFPVVTIFILPKGKQGRGSSGRAPAWKAQSQVQIPYCPKKKKGKWSNPMNPFPQMVTSRPVPSGIQGTLLNNVFVLLLPNISF
jgi:hypothetical protein